MRISPTLAGYWRQLWFKFRSRGAAAAVLALAAFVVSVAWVLWGQEHGSELEPWANLLNVLSLIAASAAAVWASMQDRVSTGDNEERYSLSYALAYGYVHNFLIPALKELRSAYPLGKFLIFRPKSLHELTDAHADDYKAGLAKRGFGWEVRNVTQSGKRARDVVVVRSRQGDNKGYFVDFPATLLTLGSLIEYKAQRAVQQGQEPWTAEYRDGLAADYIKRFFQQVELQLIDTDERQYIDYTDNEFRGL